MTALFAAENGWPFGEIKDSDPKIFEKEQQLESQYSNPVRAVSMLEVAHNLTTEISNSLERPIVLSSSSPKSITLQA